MKQQLKNEIKIETHQQRTNGNIRSLGIGVIDKAPWGTHICQFYQTKKDLIDILVPYFKVGLENNELCIWITSEPLTAEEAKEGLQREVKNLDDYINNGQIEILDYGEWYVKSGKFDPDRVLQLWVDKENQALRRGFDGIRTTGNNFWLDQKDWRDFTDYEAAVDSVIGKHRMLAICSYSLNKCDTSEILNVVGNHQYAIIRQSGKWGIIQSAGRERPEEELIRKNNDLGEGIKELNCLYGLSHLVEKDLSLEGILQGTVELIPPAWQYPEITCVRIILKDKTFKTENFEETQWKLAQDVIVHGSRIGTLEVYHLEERPESDEGPFLKEERSLINAITERLGRIIERKWSEKELKKYRLHLEELVKERTAELAGANENLRREVIQRKEIEKFLRKNEERWRKYFELGLIGIAVTSPEKKWIEVNDHLCQILGYSRQELIKMTWSELTYQENLESDLAQFNRMLIGEIDGVKTETRFVRKDGKIIDASTSTRCLRNQNGTIEYFIVLVQDITDRKQAEEALKRSEENYKILVENSRDFICVVDPRGNFIFTNKAFETILGYTPEDLNQINGLELIHPEDLEIVKKWLNEVINGKIQNDIEYRYKTKKGPYINILVNAVPLFDPEGNVFAAYGIGRDITERKCMEEALRESEIKYSTLVEQANDSISILQDGVFVYVNRMTAEILGYTVEELIGKPLVDILVPESRNENLQRLKSRMSGERVPTRYENRCVCKDGTIKDVELSLNVIQYQGKPALLTIVRDITEQKEIEEKLRKSEGILSTAQQIAHLGSWEYNIETDEVIWSDEQFRIFGYEPGEIKPTFNHFVKAIHTDDRERVLLAVQQAIDGIKTYEIEFRIIQPDKTVRTILAKADVFRNKDDKPVRIVGTVLDITDRKRMEEELQKIEKLEAIGVLAGGIAHDFNNLLTEIIGNLSLVELYTTPGDNIFDYLQSVKKASKRAGQLTKQLLTFSKGGAPIKETTSIPELIEDTTSFALRGSKVRDEYSLPNNLWPVEIDKGQMSQVINNLVINANHAMPDGGIITISAENVIINGNNILPLKKGKYVKISVKDQGIGIPEEHLDKIFDPYFTTKENGSGLGLASCYSIVINHGGYITVESEAGSGTRFDIYLPVSDKEIFEVKEIVEEKVFYGQGTILFMDDEEGVINAAQQMIVKLGYEIKIARNGIEAINMYKRAKEFGEPFDLVILDLTISGDMGGEETIKRLLEIDPEVKAVVSSGYSNNPVMAEYTKYGFKGVVAKPYEIKELSETLYKVINGKDESINF